MEGFDLDLLAVEGELEDAADEEYRIVLDVLDGTHPAEERIRTVQNGIVLMLAVEGDLNELAAGFAREIKDMGGNLVHFRGFLIVTPPGVPIDADRLE